MMRICAFVSALLLTAAAAQQPAAQQPASDPQTPTFKVQAREVLLQVSVRDKKGFVAGLGPKDFTLSEDGRAQTIKSFSRETNLPFRIGMLVDTGRGMNAVMETERKAAAKFVDTMLPADRKGPDQAFLIHFDSQVELLRDFTNSREKLDKELADMSTSRPSRDDRQGPETTDSGGNQRGGDRSRGRGGNSGGTQLYDAIFLASDELMKTVQGRKALIVFSDGVDRNSKDTLNEAIDAADRAGLEVFTIYLKGEEEHNGGNGNNGGGRRGGMGGGWPGGGGGYPGGNGGGSGGGNGGGGRRGGGGDEVKVDGKKIMEQIAQRTGGRFFEAKKKENLEEIYGQIVEELRNQYLLTYSPDKAADGEYHKVQLKGRKDDWTVATREGYYAEEK